jgi:uncharacterized protein (DUF2141 family)
MLEFPTGMLLFLAGGSASRRMQESYFVYVAAVFMDSDGDGSLQARRPIELSSEDFGVLPTRVVGLTTPRFGS